MKVLIDVREMSVSFSGKSVFEKVSFRLADKTAISILGPSGVGKSTLLRSLCRMNDRVPNFNVSGSVLVMGEDIYREKIDLMRLRRTVGLVFQKPCVFAGTILDNALFALRYHSPDKKKQWREMTEQALKEVSLWDEVKDRLGSPAGLLSWGQQQRLCIARLLVMKPRVLLFDEPTASLDVKNREAIESLMIEQKKHRGLILVTHDERQAESVADHCLRCKPVVS